MSRILHLFFTKKKYMSVDDGKHCIIMYNVVCIMIILRVTDEPYRTELFLNSLCGQLGK